MLEPWLKDGTLSLAVTMQFLTEANEGNEGGPGGSGGWTAYTPAHQMVSAHRWRILPFGQHRKPSLTSFASVQLNCYGLVRMRSHAPTLHPRISIAEFVLRERSRSRRWQDFQAVLLCDLNDAREVLLLLRAQRTDFLEKTFEARGSDQAHESPRRLAEIPVGVRNAPWSKNRRAFLSDECLPAHG